jgi:hypothetical protein
LLHWVKVLAAGTGEVEDIFAVAGPEVGEAVGVNTCVVALVAVVGLQEVVEGDTSVAVSIAVVGLGKVDTSAAVAVVGGQGMVVEFEVVAIVAVVVVVGPVKAVVEAVVAVVGSNRLVTTQSCWISMST